MDSKLDKAFKTLKMKTWKHKLEMIFEERCTGRFFDLENADLNQIEEIQLRGDYVISLQEVLNRMQSRNRKRYVPLNPDDKVIYASRCLRA